MATFALLAAFVSCAAAGEASLRGSSTNASSTEVSNITWNATAASEDLEAWVPMPLKAPSEDLEALQAMPLNDFAVSNHGCNIKCVYSDWARGVCHGTTCVCSGLKSSQPLSLPNTCRAPARVSSRGDDSCNVVCVYSDWFRGRCSGNKCICSGGKSSQPFVVPGHYC